MKPHLIEPSRIDPPLTARMVERVDETTHNFRRHMAADHLCFVCECIVMMQGGNLTPEAYRILTQAMDRYRDISKGGGK